ncbi:MAG: signal peptide peptidase SppA [Pelagibacterales bacterium]|nr:signal peptide peptidase SppA [Pelagibacterales bacterium]
MNSSDNLAALIYLKNKVHKWKNLSILCIFVVIILFLRILAGDNLSDGVPEGSDYIAEIKIEGVIFENDFRSEVLEKIALEKSVKAVIVNIDSPGGGIVGSEILFEDLRKIAEKKPIAVVMGSVAASGGYMAAIASDYIIAHNGTLTGSIGVLMESPEFTELARKVGVKFNSYKSSPLKGSPSPFEKSNSLVDAVVQESINDSYVFFSDLVRQRRGEKLVKDTRFILDGRVFTGRQALKVGLIDEIGGEPQALSYFEKSRKIDIKHLPIKEISIVQEEKSFFDKFKTMLPFFDKVDALTQKRQIMAIMPY